MNKIFSFFQENIFHYKIKSVNQTKASYSKKNTSVESCDSGGVRTSKMIMLSFDQSRE